MAQTIRQRTALAAAKLKDIEQALEDTTEHLLLVAVRQPRTWLLLLALIGVSGIIGFALGKFL